MTLPLSRRDLVRSGLLAGGAAAVTQLLPQHASAQQERLAKGTTILFQGDSITDAGRNRQRNGANNASGLGAGYPFLIASYLLATRPKDQLKLYNRGISGNKVPDLYNRWQPDCIELKPSILSILIGVNDIWHKLNGNYAGNVDTYKSGLQALLKRTQKALPYTKIVICEPFVLRCGAVNDKWFPEFDQRRQACRDVANKLQCTWVPFQSMFDNATDAEVAPSYWAGDGVHPSVAGHALMAKTWLETVF